MIPPSYVLSLATITTLKNGHFDVLRLLVDKWANIFDKCNISYNPIIVACNNYVCAKNPESENKYLDIIRYLGKLGADIDSYQNSIEIKKLIGWTPDTHIKFTKKY